MTAKMQPFWYFKVPPIVCPSGEQIVNGGFETGLFLPAWVIREGYATIFNFWQHSGTYACWISYEGWIEQTLSEPLPVQCVQTFKLWAMGFYSSGDTLVRVRVYYDDDSTSVHDFYVPSYTYEYTECTVTGLTTGKKIVKFRIECDAVIGPFMVDDVSLTGTG